MDEKSIARINELYHKSQAEGLTDAEKTEQQLLRKEYIASIRRNIKSQLNSIDMIDENGDIVNLGEKYDKKGSEKTS
ncbi:MAG: DUF896 domain-containing protein [Lachnospiraceae bacterium]|nr:DUF896 domain-containing protein [Lachnospiraceae bacterium]